MLFLEPVTSILLGYKVDGLMSKDGSLVVWLVEHVDVWDGFSGYSRVVLELC